VAGGMLVAGGVGLRGRGASWWCAAWELGVGLGKLGLSGGQTAAVTYAVAGCYFAQSGCAVAKLPLAALQPRLPGATGRSCWLVARASRRRRDRARCSIGGWRRGKDFVISDSISASHLI
jgi:hypothetical protein